MGTNRSSGVFKRPRRARSLSSFQFGRTLEKFSNGSTVTTQDMRCPTLSDVALIENTSSIVTSADIYRGRSSAEWTLELVDGHENRRTPGKASTACNMVLDTEEELTIAADMDIIESLGGKAVSIPLIAVSLSSQPSSTTASVAFVSPIVIELKGLWRETQSDNVDLPAP